MNEIFIYLDMEILHMRVRRLSRSHTRLIMRVFDSGARGWCQFSSGKETKRKGREQ